MIEISRGNELNDKLEPTRNISKTTSIQKPNASTYPRHSVPFTPLVESKSPPGNRHQDHLVSSQTWERPQERENHLLSTKLS